MIFNRCYYKISSRSPWFLQFYESLVDRLLPAQNLHEARVHPGIWHSTPPPWSSSYPGPCCRHNGQQWQPIFRISRPLHMRSSCWGSPVWWQPPSRGDLQRLCPHLQLFGNCLCRPRHILKGKYKFKFNHSQNAIQLRGSIGSRIFNSHWPSVFFIWLTALVKGSLQFKVLSLSNS